MTSSSTHNTVNSTYPRIYIGDYVRTFIMDIRKREGRIFKTNNPNEVSYMKELLNTPKYTAFKSTGDFNTGISFWNEQKVDCIPSNLGIEKGYIFYFVCNGCRQQVKSLYQYSMQDSPLCRVCCRLDYETPPNKARKLIRLLRKPHYPDYPSEVRYMIAKYAGIRREDLVF